MLYDVIIPWRDRGTDPLRSLNLMAVLNMWEEYGYAPYVVGDGKQGREQFNRSAAYNRGIEMAGSDTDGFIFAESDMLIDDRQIAEAVKLANSSPGMVVPFTQYRYLTPEASMRARNGENTSDLKIAWAMDDGKSIGAINVVSRRTMEMIGQWDEKFDGNWYDDDAMKVAFDTCASPTRFIEGPAWHLHHLPGHRGSHLSAEDKTATARNRVRLGKYKEAALGRSPVERIRELTTGVR